jgi:dynein heavy chain 1
MFLGAWEFFAYFGRNRYFNNNLLSPCVLIAVCHDQVLQLDQICNQNHGLMVVGPSGSGKSTAWRVLLRSLERLDGMEGVAHVIDPKAISKEALYGVLDPNTREWTDGLFTHILR